MDDAAREAAGRAVRGHLEATLAALADETVPLPWGTVARTRSLAAVHTLNSVRVTGAADPTEVLAAAERHQADLPYRHLFVTEAATASALEGTLDPAEWRVEHELFLALDPGASAGGPSAGVSPVAGVVDLDETEAVGLYRRWLTEEGFGAVPGELDQLETYARREGRLWEERRLGVRGPSGAPVAMTKVRHRGPTWWVEDVYTAPEVRRRGYARALVSRAVDVARGAPHDLVFIVADDDDWPKELYQSVGFQPVGRTWTWHRDRAARGAPGAGRPVGSPGPSGPPAGGPYDERS